MRVFVTGGSGFVGSHIVDKSVKSGYEVFNYDLKVDKRLDILKPEVLQSEIQRFEPDVIYHCAGQVFLAPGEEDPVRDNRLNAVSMIYLCKAIEGTDVSMVFTSTGAVYGLSGLPHREDMRCLPVCNYGVSKLMAEEYLRKWVATEGVNAKIVRFSSVYGGKRKAGPVNMFLEQAAKGGPIKVFGSGNQTRDFVHIDDVVRGLEMVHERGARGEVYNIGTGVETSVNQVAQLVKLKHYPELEIEFVPGKGSIYDLPRSWFDVTKAASLGFKAKVDLEFGIALTRNDMEKE